MRFVVVGAGPAGCAFASAVAPDHDVVVVEAGDRHPPDGDLLRPLPGADERLVRTPVRRSAVEVDYVCGRGVGGGALVNGGFVVGEPDPLVAGLLPVERPGAIGPMAAALLASHPSAELGWLVAQDGRRVDLAEHLLDPHASITLTTGSPVARVVLDGRRAVGVETEDGSQVAADVVVMCAGALATPTLLLRSGVDTPGIGERLHDTTSVPIVVELADPAVDAPPLAVSADRDRHRLITVERAEHAAFGVLLVSLTTTTGRGRLTLPDPDGPPVVELGQLVSDDDCRSMTTAVDDAAETLRHPAWSGVVRAVAVDEHGTSLDALVGHPDRVTAWAADHLGGTYHATATCSLACDERGLVLGHGGLVVADASLLPATPSHNPFLAVISQAARLGARWRGSASSAAVWEHGSEPDVE